MAEPGPADGDLDRSVALVQANMPKLQEFAAANNIAYGNDDELCANPACAKEVAASGE